jgi:ethanolamine utilization protein EutA (predicted chaperonin)
VARSIRDECVVMNVDVGGGTSKIAVCAEGKVVDLTALDVGARLICLEPDGKIVRVEAAGHRFGAELGLDLRVGAMLTLDQGRALAGLMADKLFEAMRGDAPAMQGASLLRLDPLGRRWPIDRIQFSGGVSEFIYGNESKKFGDLGPLLAAEILARVESFCPRLEPSIEGIRATVVGASQYTIQLSGSTIYVAPLDAVPLRNVPVIAPALPLDQEAIDPTAIASAVQTMLKQLDLAQGEQPVALFVPWRGSATYQRLDAFCRGVVEGLSGVLARGHPLVLAGDGDVGGLLGIHLHEEMKIANPVVSIDGLELKAFDYIDIGTMLESSGAVPVVIKSLIFPGSAPARERPLKGSSPLGGEADPNSWHFKRTNEDGPLPNPVGHTFPLLTHDQAGIWRLIGTGFYVSSDGLFVTARHVVNEVLCDGRQISPIVILQPRSNTGLFGPSDVLFRPIMQCWLGEQADVALGVAASATNDQTGEVLRHWCWPLSWTTPHIGAQIATYAFPRHRMSDDGQNFLFHPELYAGVIRAVGEFRDRGMMPFSYLEVDCRIHGAASGGPMAAVAGRVVGVNCTELAKTLDHPPGPAFGAQISCLKDSFIDDAALPGETGTRRVTFDELVRAGCIDVTDYVARNPNEKLSGSIIRLDMPITARHPGVSFVQYA